MHLPSTGPGPDAPIIMTGHQPSLVHPGVWAKNFAADRIAHMVGGQSINLVVDTDMLGDRGIRLPERDGEGARLVRFEYDSTSPAAPYVESRIADASAFESFGSHVSRHMQSQWGITPLMQSNWPDAVPIGPNETLGYSFTRMRYSQELRWGLGNLEVFLSHLVDTIVFSRFFLDMVRRADQFLDIHNRAIVEYRQTHRLRSQSHPVPMLVREGERIELPFWSWSAGEMHRQPLFAIRGKDSIELFDAGHRLAEFPTHASDADYDLFYEQFITEGQRIAPLHFDDDTLLPSLAGRPVHSRNRWSCLRSDDRPSDQGVLWY